MLPQVLRKACKNNGTIVRFEDYENAKIYCDSLYVLLYKSPNGELRYRLNKGIPEPENHATKSDSVAYRYSFDILDHESIEKMYIDKYGEASSQNSADKAELLTSFIDKKLSMMRNKEERRILIQLIGQEMIDTIIAFLKDNNIYED